MNGWKDKGQEKKKEGRGEGGEKKRTEKERRKTREQKRAEESRLEKRQRVGGGRIKLTAGKRRSKRKGDAMALPTP